MAGPVSSKYCWRFSQLTLQGYDGLHRGRASGGRIVGDGEIHEIDHGARQYRVGFLGVRDHRISRARNEFLPDILGQQLGELIAGGEVGKRRHGDGLDVFGNQVGAAGHVIAASGRH